VLVIISSTFILGMLAGGLLSIIAEKRNHG
jgi:hypothetical protein